MSASLMTPNTSLVDALAASLVQAYTSRTPISAVDWRPEMTSAEQAYAVQEIVDGIRHSGLGPRYWKSGGASRNAVLTHAPLPAARLVSSPANLSHVHFFAPGIEAEVALRLGQDVSPQEAADLQAEDADALVEAIAVTIEIVDSRWADGAASSPLLKLADAQSHGALVVGDWQPWHLHAARDWAAQPVEARVGSSEPVTRAGTHPMGHPTWLLPTWLRHATRRGDTVPAGTVVTTGSWVGILPASRGDLVKVYFPGIGETEVRI